MCLRKALTGNARHGEWLVEDYAIGVAKGNTALLDAINAAMAELKAEGTFQAIVDKYITAE